MQKFFLCFFRSILSIFLWEGGSKAQLPPRCGKKGNLISPNELDEYVAQINKNFPFLSSYLIDVQQSKSSQRNLDLAPKEK